MGSWGILVAEFSEQLYGQKPPLRLDRGTAPRAITLTSTLNSSAKGRCEGDGGGAQWILMVKSIMPLKYECLHSSH